MTPYHAERLAELHAVWPADWKPFEMIDGDAWEAEIGDLAFLRAHRDTFGWRTSIHLLDDEGFEMAHVAAMGRTVPDVQAALSARLLVLFAQSAVVRGALLGRASFSNPAHTHHAHKSRHRDQAPEPCRRRLDTATGVRTQTVQTEPPPGPSALGQPEGAP